MGKGFPGMTITPEDLAGAVLSIDLGAVKENWQRL